MAEIYKSKFSGQEIDERLELIPEIQEGVEAAQQTADEKYTKPASGIPMTDLSDEVQEAIEEGGGQADWAQTDTTAPDYIKNKPSIPTHVVRFVQQFLSDSERTQARANIGAGTYSKPATGIPAEDIADDVIPDVSDFITNTVNDLVNYYLKSETYSRSEVQQLIAAIQGVSFVSVATLPTASADTMGGKIYLVPSTNPDTQNVKDEFITIQDGSTYYWEQIGSTAIDLSGYVTIQQLNTALAAYTTTEALTTLLAAKQDTISDLSAIRSGAAAGATAYQKPQTGIPASDLASGVIPTVPTDIVKYSSQSLTDAQQAQARTNIGAAAASALTALETAIAAKYTKPSSGIPETDLASGVQSALALARTSIQSLADYYDKTQIDSLLAAVSSEQYVDVTTLPTASASTLGKIYLVGPTNGVYDRYYTSYDGTTYSWVGVGTTEINLANYATKAELNQLSQKLDTITIDVVAENEWQSGRVLINVAANTDYSYIAFQAKAGDVLVYHGVCDANTCFLGYGNNGAEKTILVHGVGSSAWVDGSVTAPVDGTYWFCVYTAGVSQSTLLIKRNADRLAFLEAELNNVNTEIGIEDEYVLPALTVQNGYISSVGGYTNSSSYRVTNPIHLAVGDTLKATLSAPPSLAVFSLTQNIADVAQRTHSVVANGLESWTTHEYTYVAEKDCYVEISYLNATALTNVKVTRANKIEAHSIEIEQMQKIVNYIAPVEDLMLKTLCIGDSLTEGCEYDENAQLVSTHIAENYPYYLQKMTRLEVTNEGHNGATPTSLINGVHARLLEYDYTPYDNFIIWLGTNDGLTASLDTDVIPFEDWHDYANTNTGNYCKIISCIIAQVPKAKIFLGSVFGTTGDKTVTNNTINSIAKLYPDNVMGVVNNDDGNLKSIGAEWDYWYHNHPQQVHFSKVGNFALARHWLLGIRELMTARLGDFRNHLLTP